MRKLVEQARRNSEDNDRIRAAQEAAYHFMSVMAGNMPGFEEAIARAVRRRRRQFAGLIAGWPDDIRDHTSSSPSAIGAAG